ncbi:hypothetical protein KUH32_14615 [Thalassococcus sp. CAU 1522]|uniref:Transposase n=1 Tax=Thalassococcus arenae TaxID=2851652 RepID=A0ABS6NAG0_9RHOB|nr:hypothetical protein [Thalassococcus arenae]MBV2360995.1 hypothetical protein [Thalassococcus arenae]
MTDSPPSIANLRKSLSEAAQLCRDASGILAHVQTCLERSVEDGVQTPFQTGAKVSSAAAEHRRAHRPGRPAKIDADPELRAFILARIDHLTFPQLEDAVAEVFPDARRVRKTAINDWWNRHRRRAKPNSHPG